LPVDNSDIKLAVKYVPEITRSTTGIKVEIGYVVVRKDGVVGVDEPSPSESCTIKCPYRAAPGVYQRTEVIVPVGGVINNSTLSAVSQPCVRSNCRTILTERLLKVKKIIGNCQTVYHQNG